MKTMYYLESETRQKLKDFQKEKAHQRLRETAVEGNSGISPLRVIRTALARLLRTLRFGHDQREQAINLERSLDEA